MASSHSARSPKFYLFGLGTLVAAAVTVAYFHYSRHQEIATVREARAAISDRGPRIEIVTTAAGPTTRTIRLLGDVRAAAAATLYSKVAGYLKVVHVDKGDRVEAGQVLAEIESPELEQQYAGAAADLANKLRNFERIKGLYERGNATQVSMYAAETEKLVAENNVAVLATNKSYQTVRAPFAGRVTARFADPGALIGNAQTNYVSAQPMMTISDDARVRVYAYLQQADVPFVKVGDPAEVEDATNPERKRMATVTRMNGELDVKTRTMLIEVHTDNKDNFIVPGAFAYVTLQVKVQSYPQIPVTALLNRGNQNIVAVLDKDIVRFRAVKVASTDGATVSLLDGLKPGEKVAINIPDEVTDGSRIQPIEAKGR
jgi:RND family efflux transporter MFP subunit